MKVALGSSNPGIDVVSLRGVFDERDFAHVEIVCEATTNMSSLTKEGRAKERAELAKQKHPDADLFIGTDHVDDALFTVTHVSVLQSKGDEAIGFSLSHLADKDSRSFDIRRALASALYHLLDKSTYLVR